MPYEIRRVNARTYDVFTGNQWDEHSRVQQGRSSCWVTAGTKLPYALLKHLHQTLAPNMPINYNQPHVVTLANCASISQ